ncbi:MAG: class F sortase [Patescibacteria group bacterium]|nr:class F sortase [Patescibacteria group bacterium]
MHEKLLLPSAKSAVIIVHDTRHWWRLAALVVGGIMVAVGAADVSSRAAHAFFGANANIVAFGPAVALNHPGAFVPAHLKVPSLGIDAPVESVATKADGSMDTPKKFGDVSWYAPGSMPGASGHAVFAGHVNNALTTAGVFEHLSEIKLGDYVSVEDSSGHTLLYKVSDIEEYALNGAPNSSVFSTTGPSTLVLITCDGSWDASQHEFDKRLVVFATPAE